MMSHTGWATSEDCRIRDYEWTGSEPHEPCDSLSAKITATIRGIPDCVWTSRTRKNVRPAGQGTCDQLTLGLISCATNNRVPMLSQCTWHLLNLTRLILLYMKKLGNFEEPIVCTSIQLSRNLEGKLHVDKNNQGNSYITGVGDYQYRETFFYDDSENAYDFYNMTSTP